MLKYRLLLFGLALAMSVVLGCQNRSVAKPAETKPDEALAKPEAGQCNINLAVTGMM